jgi:short-subunit dehydrogenase
MSSSTVLITGASVGLGYEFAKLFARDRYDLVLVARDQQRLTAVASELKQQHGIQVRVLPVNLAVPNASEEIVRTLKEAGVVVDVLVNNAGFGQQGPFHTNPHGNELSMIQVNIAALVHLTKLILPGMVERKNGRIMNVASTAAFQPGPNMAVYYATKSFVLSFSEALSEELRGTGVHVSAFCPGPTRTEFQSRAGISNAMMKGFAGMDAAPVASIGYKGLMRGKRVVIPGVINRIGVFFAKISPNIVLMKVIKSLHKE